MLYLLKKKFTSIHYVLKGYANFYRWLLLLLLLLKAYLHHFHYNITFSALHPVCSSFNCTDICRSSHASKNFPSYLTSCRLFNCLGSLFGARDYVLLCDFIVLNNPSWNESLPNQSSNTWPVSILFPTFIPPEWNLIGAESLFFFPPEKEGRPSSSSSSAQIPIYHQ